MMMFLARMVRSPLSAVTVTPERMVTSPWTMTAPFIMRFIVTASLSSAHIPDAHAVVQLSTVDHAVPAMLHSSTFLALQRRVPLLHAPVHRPDTHETAHVEEW